MQIFVAISAHNKTTLLNCSPSDTTRSLKEKISKAQHIDVKDQILNYACKILKDDLPLDSYDVKPNSTLHLNLRLKGGMQPAVVCFIIFSCISRNRRLKKEKQIELKWKRS